MTVQPSRNFRICLKIFSLKISETLFSKFSPPPFILCSLCFRVCVSEYLMTSLLYQVFLNLLNVYTENNPKSQCFRNTYWSNNFVLFVFVFFLVVHTGMLYQVNDLYQGDSLKGIDKIFLISYRNESRKSFEVLYLHLQLAMSKEGCNSFERAFNS